MSTSADQHHDPSLTGEGLTIKDAGKFLGVPGPTLRSWERRYGLPTTTRSLGGHRRYRSAELIQLSLMRDEIAIGRQAADAARWVRGMLDEGTAGDGAGPRSAGGFDPTGPAAPSARSWTWRTTRSGSLPLSTRW